jgi:hypothetical protein
MLSAKDSTIMPEKNHHRRTFFPEGTQARCLAVRVRECDIGELAAERIGHVRTFWAVLAELSSSGVFWRLLPCGAAEFYSGSLVS